MKDGNLIEVHDVKKSFKVYLDKGFTLKEKALFKKRRRYEKREVLKGISFEVKRGEAIGLIGHNGCGKSTTLKMLTGIMYPDSGTIEMNGRISSLIELGAGFQPDMSGRDNIYINASILGLTKQEIDNRLNDIIAFSELEEFIDNPVRTYSSGMYMRLAFAVAINVDADILLIDEILAVGDISFQAKCFSKLQEIKQNGATIVIVSHSLGQIEQMCDRSIWINDGVIQCDGDPRAVHAQYRDYMGRVNGLDSKPADPEPIVEVQAIETDEVIGSDEAIKREWKRWGNGRAKITDIHFEDADGRVRDSFATGEKIIIKIGVDAYADIACPVVGVGFRTSGNVHFYGSNTAIDQVPKFSLNSGEHYNFECVIERNPFMTDEYQIEVAVETSDTLEQLDYWVDAMRFSVKSLTDDIGLARVEHKWNTLK